LLKEENLRLKEMALSQEMVEQLRLENKLMKLEIQKMKETSDYDISFVRSQNNVLSTKEMSSGSHFSLSGVQTQRNSFASDPFQEFRDADPSVKPPGAVALEEKRHEVRAIRSSLQRSGRCPICTLQPPCNHYRCLNELMRQGINEVNEHLEETTDAKADLVLPKLGATKNSSHTKSMPQLNLQALPHFTKKQSRYE